MASQKWIFDPPPPPPPKKTAGDGVRENNGQRERGGAHARGHSGWKKRGHGRQQGHGRQRDHRQQWQAGHVNTTVAGSFMPLQTGHFPALQPATMGFPTAPFPLMYPPYSTPYQYYPQQQYPIAQPPPQQDTSQETRPDTRKLLVYQSQPPQQNSYGYSMSSTAYSLPSHHFAPQPDVHVELSEEEIRAALERSKAKNKLRYVPRLNTVLIEEYSDRGDEHCAGYGGRRAGMERGTEEEMVV